jgi:hypothetical protein
MTSWQEPPAAEPIEIPEETQPEPSEQDFPPERPHAQPRPRRQRPQPNPAIDPRLVQLDRRSRRPSRTGDLTLLVIGLAAFVFGVAMHGWVASSILSSGDSKDNTIAIESTATPSVGTGAAATPTVAPQPTATPLPDRTSCDEIRGTQYRSVTEREFFLKNCTS